MTWPDDARDPYPGREPPLQPSCEQLTGPDVDHLLVSVGHGDVRALSDFYRITAPAVFGLLRGVQLSRETAEQATEQVYLRVWRAAPQFDPDNGTAYSLLMRTARREMARWLTERMRWGVQASRSIESRKSDSLTGEA